MAEPALEEARDNRRPAGSVVIERKRGENLDTAKLRGESDGGSGCKTEVADTANAGLKSPTMQRGSNGVTAVAQFG